MAGIAGDQQAALFGQACHRPGLGKNTYGTGSFVLMNTGSEPVSAERGLLTTVAWGIGDRTDYALEASVFVTGAAIQWLRDGLGIISSATETEAMAALARIERRRLLRSRPHRARARRTGTRTRAGRSSGSRAGPAASTWRAPRSRRSPTRPSTPWRRWRRRRASGSTELRADGGAVANAWLMQFQADVLGRPVVVPEVAETTALGAAYLAGIAAGAWTLDRSERCGGRRARYEPRMGEDERASLLAGWRRALERSRDWARAGRMTPACNRARGAG